MSITAPAIHIPSDAPPPVSGSKNGEYYDRCPEDGCIETERQFKSGGRDSKGEEYLDWATYFADPRKGGCGTNWSRTTKQGIERDHARGIKSKWATRAAMTGQFQLSTSERYRANYDCAFQKCGCPEIGDGHRCGVGCHASQPT